MDKIGLGITRNRSSHLHDNGAREVSKMIKKIDWRFVKSKEKLSAYLKLSAEELDQRYDTQSASCLNWMVRCYRNRIEPFVKHLAVTSPLFSVVQEDEVPVKSHPFARRDTSYNI